jgi:hypothetical protein
MASTPPQTPNPISGDDRNLVVVDENYLALTFEDKVRIFWERHGRTVIAALAVLVLFFAARYLFGLYADYRENAVRAAYSEAGDDLDALRSFANDNPGAALAGLALTKIADAAYNKGDYTAAAESYAAAAPLLSADPVGGRVRMGKAISLLKAKDAGALSEFEKLANDTSLAAPLRGEAAYHLGVIAKEDGRAADATRWLSLAVSADTSGLWAQRANRLLERMPAGETTASAVDISTGVPVKADEASAVSFPNTAK